MQKGIADELLIQIYRPDLASYLPQLSKPEVMEARDRIPTAIALLSGQRNRPTPLPLIQEKVRANREQGLGTGLFYLESLWSLGPEPTSERIAGLKQLLAPKGNTTTIPAAFTTTSSSPVSTTCATASTPLNPAPCQTAHSAVQMY